MEAETVAETEVEIDIEADMKAEKDSTETRETYNRVMMEMSHWQKVVAMAHAAFQ